MSTPQHSCTVQQLVYFKICKGRVTVPTHIRCTIPHLLTYQVSIISFKVNLFYLLLFIFNLFSHMIQFVFNHIDKELVVNVVITETVYFSILSSFRFLNTAIMSMIKCRLLYRVLHLRTILSFFRSYNDCRSCKKIQLQHHM